MGSSPKIFETASASSGSTRVRVTSEMPIGGRFTVPLKIQSDMRSARSILWLCSPRTQEMASTTFDLPHPFGPMMQVTPLPLNTMFVFSQKDLKPKSSTLRSLSTLLLGNRELPRAGAAQFKFRMSRARFRDKNRGGSRNAGPAAWRFGEAVMPRKITRGQIHVKHLAEDSAVSEDRQTANPKWGFSRQGSRRRRGGQLLPPIFAA